MPEHTPAPTPARSLYGFFMYCLSKTALGIYCIWAFTPDYYLHYFNIYYYPQKYWTTAIPIQCLVALTMFAFLIYPSSNLMLTPNIDNISNICDSYSCYTSKVNINNEDKKSCICTDESKCMKYNYKPSHKDVIENTVPQLQDLKIGFVSAKLYLNRNKQF